MIQSIRIEPATLYLVPVVKGLVSEGEKVSQAYDEVLPDAIAVSISHEDLGGLRRREDYDRYEPSDLEIIYQAFLERFGEVRLPPPAYVRGLELSEEHGTTIIPVDMNEVLYTDTYCAMVRTGDMIRESFFTRRATRKSYDLSSPEAFVRSWDRRVNRAKGFQELERARENHMAETLRRLCGRYERILTVVECERSDGVVASLKVEGAGNQATSIK